MKPDARIDRRTARTRAALRDALVRLLRQKDYDSISIQDIIDEANVGRSTFYSHCSGKGQLLRMSLGMMREELATAHGGAPRVAERPFAFSLPLLEHMASHRDLYRSLARGRGNDLFMGELRQMVRELSKPDLARLPQDHGLPREVAAGFVVSTFIGLLSWWLARQGRISPDDLDKSFQRLIRRGLS